jgi:L-ascorbate metabolism protein UlaG (beta-lactamase superfamily)
LYSTGILAQKTKRFPSCLSQDSAKIWLDSKGQKSISFYYSGCAGFLIKKGNDAVLNDPFFSNQGPLSTLPFQTLATDTIAVSKYFKKNFGQNTDQKGVIKALLATHTHYDHVLDIPHIYHSSLNRDSVLVLGSAGLKNLLMAAQAHYQSTISQDHIKVIDKNLAADSARSGQWFYTTNKRIKILPIITSHAPHFFGLKMYKGKIDSLLTQVPTKASAYKEGQSLAYLIDFLSENDQIDFRVYVQGSANSVDLGYPPSAILAQKQIDVAILCVASFAYTTRHPEAILERLKPRFILLSHWENFFKPHQIIDNRPLSVPFTNVEKFLQKIQTIADNAPQKPAWLLPNLQTLIEFKY